jgi:hypothetical protein
MEWKIEYDNDTGAYDEYFVEWWKVTNGEKTFECKNESHAKWLAELLNEIKP